VALDQRRQNWLWGAVASLVPLLAIPGVVSSSSLFFARDLTSWFFPHHAWFRQTILAGQLPFWNPYLGFGYSTANEPALQTFFPLTLPLRFLPTHLGFNLIVGLPPAIAALGMYVFLARRASRPAACLGAIVFGASGPMLSTANMPNLSWSCACVPWVLASVEMLADATTLRRTAAVAVAFGVTLLAGEPVTFFAAACLALAYAAFATPPGFRRRARVAGATAVALAFGVMLAAVQILPTAAIASGSIRSEGALKDMWSLNPLRLFETVAPFVFGKYTGLPHEITQWLFVLNDGKEPLLFSIFFGVPALLLAVLGATTLRTHRIAAFWIATGVVGLFAAFGSHTPLYRGALQLFPSLSMFRYPSKYLIVTVMAVSVLAALGWDVVASATRRKLVAPFALGIVLAAGASTVLVVSTFSPDTALSVAASWASSLHLPNPASGAQSLFREAGAAAPRLLMLATAGSALILLAASRLRTARFARGALLVLVAADLVVANAPINPTLDSATLAPFDWVELTKRHPGDRLFVARDFLSENRATEDIPPPLSFPPDRPVVAHQAVYEVALGADLSASAVPTVLSREVTGLRPREYFWLLQSFTRADRAMKYRFLSWAATRYALTMSPPPLPAERLAQLPAGSPALYEMTPSGSRVFVASRTEVERSSQRQVERLFEPGFDPSTTVLVSDGPMPQSGAGAADARATIVEETATSVRVDVEGPGGYLVLLDSFDPGWRATIDGAPSPVLRADGVFRTVLLSAGRHDVRFTYSPEHWRTGAMMSGLTAAFLAVIALRARRETAVASEPSPAATPPQTEVPAT
jgi:hypothetical protein